MRQICVSLLKTIQEYDEAIEAAEEAQGSATFLNCKVTII